MNKKNKSGGPRQKIIGYIIMTSQGGFAAPGAAFEKGILAPSPSPVQFTNRRAASRAIKRTEHVVAVLSKSLIRGWDRIERIAAILPLRIAPVFGASVPPKVGAVQSALRTPQSNAPRPSQKSKTPPPSGLLFPPS